MKSPWDLFVLGMNCYQKQAEDQLRGWQVAQADMD